MFAPSTWKWTLLMAASPATVALTMTVPEIVAPEFGELIDTVSVLPGWLFGAMRPEQPEIAALNSKMSGHALRGIFCESVWHNLHNFIIETPGLLSASASFEILAERTPGRLFFFAFQATEPRLD